MLEQREVIQGMETFYVRRPATGAALVALWQRCVRVATRRFGRRHGLDPETLVVLKYPATELRGGGLRIDIAVGPQLVGLGGEMSARRRSA